MKRFYLEDFVDCASQKSGLDQKRAVDLTIALLTKRTPNRYKTEGLKTNCCVKRVKAERDKWANVVGISAEFHKGTRVKEETLNSWKFWYELHALLIVCPDERIFLKKE